MIGACNPISCPNRVDFRSPYFCGEGFPDHVVERALAQSGFDQNGTKRFPAPWKFDIPINPATGKPALSKWCVCFLLFSSLLHTRARKRLYREGPLFTGRVRNVLQFPLEHADWGWGLLLTASGPLR